MTRRRFRHCQNEKCNRRLEELLPASGDEPTDTAAPDPLCPACRELSNRVASEEFERGLEVGTARNRRAWGLAGAGAVLVLELAAWLVVRVAAWIAAAPPA